MAKSNRVKSTAALLIPIASWQEADDLVRKAGDIQLDLNKHQRSAKMKIDRVKENLAAETAPLQEHLDHIVRSLEAFCDHHQEDFGKKRSRHLAFGIVGWRKSSKIRTKKTTLQKILDVFGRSASSYIRTKQEPDKEALAKLDDEQLKKVDAKREVTDDFFVEPDIPETADYGKSHT